jgi:hypothetical protein
VFCDCGMTRCWEISTAYSPSFVLHSRDKTTPHPSPPPQGGRETFVARCVDA